MTTEVVQVIQDLAVVLLAGALVTALFRRLGLPPMIGFILAGIILGPYTPPFSFLIHPDILNLLAQIGIVFLFMFLGMEYPIARLRTVGFLGLAIAASESLVTFAAGFVVGIGLGLSTFNSLFLGLAVSVTSSIVLLSVFEEFGILREETARLVMAVTVIEDVIVISALGILQSAASTGGLSAEATALSLGLVLAFIAGTLVVGSRIIPRLVTAVAAYGRKDLFLLSVLAIGFGLSVLSSLIGISVAAGAFFAGVMVAESKAQAIANEMVTPLKELFGAIFFISMGALMDVGILPTYIVVVGAFLAVSFGMKFVVTYLVARNRRLSSTSAKRAATAMAGPRGELSLVVAKGGADVSATSSFVLPVVGVLTLITSIATPFLVRLAWRLVPSHGN
jgi:CPA2 family monovalent cation:H+ antiporter-2